MLLGSWDSSLTATLSRLASGPLITIDIAFPSHGTVRCLPVYQLPAKAPGRPIAGKDAGPNLLSDGLCCFASDCSLAALVLAWVPIDPLILENMASGSVGSRPALSVHCSRLTDRNSK